MTADGGVPAELTRLVGRADLLAAGEDFLQVARLVTLTGTAGVGKTRLALRLANQVADRYDGVAVVSLTDIDGRDDGRLEGELATSLGLGDNSSEPGPVRLIKYLRDRHQLLVLDNCDHLVSAAGEPGPLPGLLRTLLRGAPRLQIIATSRVHLGIEAEHLLVVPPLDHAALPSGGGEVPEAVQLLLDRAAARGVRLTRSDYPAATKLCRRLEGLPLAIELAASRLAVNTLDEIMANLEDAGALEVLAGDGRSLRRTLASSARWLSPEGRHMWAIASEFQGAFRAQGLAGVFAELGLDQEAVLNGLEELLNNSVLVRADGRRGQSRYRMHDSMRAYGQELDLPEGIDRAAVRRGHATYFVGLAQQAAQEWFGRDEIAWMHGLIGDAPNLRAAFEYLLSQPGEQIHALAMAVNMCRTRAYAFDGRLNEIRRLLNRALDEQPAEPSDPQLAALALGAWTALIQGKPSAAEPLLERCRDIADQLQRVPPAAILEYIEGTHLWLAETDRRTAHGSIAVLDRAAELARNDGDAHMMKLFAAMAAAFLGTREEALAHVEPVLAEAQARGAPLAVAWAQWTYAVALQQHSNQQHGDLDRALGFLRQSLRAQDQMGDAWGPGFGLWLAAVIAADRGDHLTAARLIGGSQQRLQQRTSAAVTGLLPFLRVQRSAEAACRRGLGDAEYEIEAAVGGSLTYEELVTLALSSPESGPEQAATEPRLGGLTRREHEVVALVAKGKSNRAIADDFQISPRTVESHVQSALAKTGASNRLELTQWFLTQNQP
ncbi:helix-turn-helix transcriptional regulator [Amycolatopsis nigrescens]|uniref:helix-turn-helix transcriptional regulator n=1 Tax=Amycolatopsis nigrescens TaxID=381445 RepID=UPI00037ACB4A|nr:LuxR C-terminal-related transcriptional regulator [Amycolatopsis nigrescens]